MLLIPVFLLIALPWLNPFASGPTPAALPLLFSWACAAVLLGMWRHGAGRWVPVAAWAWLVAGLLSSVIGLCQYFGVVANFSPWMSQAGAGEAFANLRQRNQFATLTSISLVALFYLEATGRFAGRLRWFVFASAALLATGNAASSSRTGLLQLVLLCALFGIWGGWRHVTVRRVLLTTIVSYGVAILVLPWVAGFDLLSQGMVARVRAGDQICSSRFTVWSNVLHLIAQKPWLGWGWGELDYAHYITLYGGPRFCDILDNAHNLPLHLAVELGIPAALAICGVSAWWVLRQRPWRETDLTRQLAWGVLAVILLHSLLEYPLWYGPFQMAVGLCVLFLWRGAGAPPEYQSNKPLAQVVRPLSAIVLIAFVGYAAWDYHRISQIYLAPETRDEVYRGDTLSKIRDSRLFRNQVRFAELSLTPLTRDNAQWTFETAGALLHYSPEPRVIEKVIESAVLLGRDDEALAHLVRYRAAFPEDHARWAKANLQVPRHLQRLY
ncbi:MAG: Wzy polymerase domain-containing protein [Polaromonas sp.]|nr:Wzy polymerase domain-containing protein [Polaromonas sp.]